MLSAPVVKNIVVILEGASPSEKEDKIISELDALNIRYCNGRYAKAIQSERINAKHLLNLSGRVDLDEFYKDILMDIPSVDSEPVPEAVKDSKPKASSTHKRQKAVKADKVAD